jgi:hypothetical protein
MHKWYTAGKDKVESTREQADKKRRRQKAKKNCKLLRERVRKHTGSYLICQDIKKQVGLSH